jgi:hypothetical protein
MKSLCRRSRMTVTSRLRTSGSWSAKALGLPTRWISVAVTKTEITLIVYWTHEYSSRKEAYPVAWPRMGRNATTPCWDWKGKCVGGYPVFLWYSYLVS